MSESIRSVSTPPGIARTHPGLVHLLVALFLFALSIPMAEGLFRITGDRPSADLEGLFTPFIDGSYKLAPNTDTQASWAAGQFSVHTDGLGLRTDARRRLAAEAGERLDVLFLGDSQGFGHGVNFSDSLAGSAADLAAIEGYRLANASVGGHAAANQFAVARWLAEEKGVVASTYVLLMGPLMIQNVNAFTRATVGADGRLYGRLPGAGERIRLWSKTHLVLYGRLRDALRNLGIGSSPQSDSKVVLDLYGGGKPEVEARRQLANFLSKVQQFAEQHGATVRLVYLPMTLEVDVEGLRRIGRAGNAKVDVEMPSRIAQAAATDLRIVFHTLRPVLEGLHSRGSPLRLEGDFHYSAALSKACGLSIWQNLKPQLLDTTNVRTRRQ